MGSELLSYSSGRAPVPIRDFGVSRAAKKIYDQARIDAFQVDAKMELAKHGISSVAEAHSFWLAACGGDEGLAKATAPILTDLITNVRKTVNGSHWNL